MRVVKTGLHVRTFEDLQDITVYDTIKMYLASSEQHKDSFVCMFIQLVSRAVEDKSKQLHQYSCTLHHLIIQRHIWVY